MVVLYIYIHTYTYVLLELKDIYNNPRLNNVVAWLCLTVKSVKRLAHIWNQLHCQNTLAAQTFNFLTNVR